MSQAADTFTPRLAGVMLVTETMGTNESNSPKLDIGARPNGTW